MVGGHVGCGSCLEYSCQECWRASLRAHASLPSCGRRQGVQWLGHVEAVYLTCKESATLSPEWQHCFTFPSAVLECSQPSVLLPALGIG